MRILIAILFLALLFAIPVEVNAQSGDTGAALAGGARSCVARVAGVERRQSRRAARQGYSVEVKTWALLPRNRG